MFELRLKCSVLGDLFSDFRRVLKKNTVSKGLAGSERDS